MQPQELREFLKKVQAELGRAWPAMEACWRSQDWAALQREAHRLKSVVGSVGCECLYEALHQLEGSLRAQPPQVPDGQALARLQTIVMDTDQALGAALQGG